MHLIRRHANASRSPLRTVALLGAAWATLQGFRLLHSRYRRVSTEAYSSIPEDAQRRFLIVGDETGVGIGSVDARASVAGRLAAAFPGTEIVNRSHDGAQSSDIAAQIATSDGKFDLVLILVGSNDATHFSSKPTMTLAAEVALEAASARSEHIAVVPPPDVGAAPLWLWPLNAVLTRRARAVRRAWQMATRERTGVHLVELRLPRHRDPFRIAPGRFYSPDGVHPNGEGYALWFAQITRQVPLFSQLS
jgi:lysophospholipase L1-like esterase